MRNTIKIKGIGLVMVDDYVTAKTKDLQEFGYSNLTEDQVRTQLGAVLEGKDDGTNVIAAFIKDDLAE